MNTAIKSEEEKKEFFDSKQELDEKVSLLAEMIVCANHVVFFTGAGISTATGIPDYRSGLKTCLPTGPGCWETKANMAKWKEQLKRSGKEMPLYQRTNFNTTIQKARPSKCHMAMVELERRGHLGAIVSQNIDGLHRKSGNHAEKLVELHGNYNLELCTKCGREHMRDYRVRAMEAHKKHLTGRICDTPGCGGALKDTIINFGENLVPSILNKGFEEHQKADLVIACGSSLRVAPASEMPVQAVQRGANFVNINL